MQTEYRYSALYLNVAKFTRQRPDKCCNIQHLSGLFLSLFYQASVLRLNNCSLNYKKKETQMRYTTVKLYSSVFKTYKQKNKRNAVKSTFLSLKIMPQTGIEPEFRSANLEKQEGSAHLLLSVIKSVSKSALCFFKKLSRFPYLHFC